MTHRDHDPGGKVRLALQSDNQMTESTPSEAEHDGGDSSAGCLVLLGLIIASIATGHIYGNAYGWLLFGGVLLLNGLIKAALRAWVTLCRRKP